MPELSVRVLLIEDNPADVGLVRAMLDEPRGRYELRAVKRIEEARTAAGESRPDVILLDLNLPDAEGLATLDRLGSLTQTVPVIVLTGTDDEEQAAAAVHRGAQDYMTKSDLNPRMLRRVIRHACERQVLLDDLRVAKEALETLSHVDSLTNALNRRGLDAALRRERDRADRGWRAAALLVLDLDDFKKINDEHGHAAGDDVLSDVVRRIRGTLRKADVLSRIGGDEFLVLLPDTRPGEARRIAERVRQAIAGELFRVGGYGITVTASAGMVCVDRLEADIGPLLRRADRALYRSKHAGKNRVSGRSDAAIGAVANCSGLRSMVRMPETYRPVSQPIVRLDDLETIGHEWFLRTTVNGLEAPGPFFDACEERGVLVEADLRSLERTLERIALADRPGRSHVNLFPSTVVRLGAATIVQMLQRAGAPRRRFCVELDEDQFVGDPVELVPHVEQLRAAGVSVGLDHADGSRRSLENLIMLEPDVVKIEAQLLGLPHAEGGPRREPERLLRLVRRLGATAVVIGVETEGQCRSLAELEVGFAQGFLWDGGAPVARRERRHERETPAIET